MADPQRIPVDADGNPVSAVTKIPVDENGDPIQSTTDKVIAGAKDLGVGGLKQIGRTAVGTMKLLNRFTPFGTPLADPALNAAADAIPADTNTAQRVGGFAADVGTSFAPMGAASKLVKGMSLIPRLVGMGAAGAGVSEAQGHDPIMGAVGGAAGEGISSAVSAVRPFLQRMAGKVWTNAANAGTPETAADILSRGRGIPSRSNTAALEAEATAGDIPATAGSPGVPMQRGPGGQFMPGKAVPPTPPTPEIKSPLWDAVAAHQSANAAGRNTLSPWDAMILGGGLMSGHGTAGAAVEAAKLATSPAARMIGAQAAYSGSRGAATAANSPAARAAILALLEQLAPVPAHGAP